MADPDYRTMINSLRLARESSGQSQTQVADKIGVTWTTLSTWERFVHTPSLFHLLAWWNVLGFEMVQQIERDQGK
jgi:DNA-binding XRE family transcriptional regulator